MTFDGNGRPAGLKGWPPEDSTYVHIWGPKNQEKQAALVNDDKYPSETLTRFIISRKRTTCTGRAPSFDKLAKVKPGGKLSFLWPTNNHTGQPIQLFWDPSDRVGNLSPNKAEPDYLQWINPKNQIFSASFKEGTKTKCTTYDFNNPNDAVSNIIKQTHPAQQSTPNERFACWSTWTVPKTVKPGLNRVLFGWAHPPNDARFYDCYWFFVNGGARPSPVQLPSTGIFSPVLYNSKYYLDHNPDLRANGVDTIQEARAHWEKSGINEGRRASATFDSRFYLNKYEDLRNAFGSNGFKSAALHFINSGRKEGRQGCNECKGKRDVQNFSSYQLTTEQQQQQQVEEVQQIQQLQQLQPFQQILPEVVVPEENFVNQENFQQYQN